MDDKSAAPTRNPIKRLYHWVLSWARHPAGTWALFFIAFAESSFFPIPPDVLLLALALTFPTRAFWYAAVCSAGSVLGGMFGYLIGWQLWDVLQQFFFNNLGWMGVTDLNFKAVQKAYADNAFLAVFGAAFTPIPYKVFTIAAGVFQINFVTFVVASIVGRSARFFGEAVLLYFFGAWAKNFIDRYFNWLALAFFLLIILGFAAIKFVF